LVKIGIVRVLTTQDESLLNAHGRLIESHFPQFETVSRCIEDQPEGIHDDRTREIAVPKVVRLGRSLESEGVNALIVSCADDPGVDELRNMVRIPVIGAGSAAASLALSLGDKVGVLIISDKTPDVIRKILGGRFLAEAKPIGVSTTLDLLREKEGAHLFSAAEELKRKGANVILLACTGYATIGIASKLRRRLGLPVVDPVLASALAVWYVTATL
jgi:allantoin racemase